MADVKWIKITTDVFDDEKILLIESLPEADSIIVIWFKLLCLAGKQNNSGVFIMGDKIAYNDKMLATIFRRKEATVQLALQTFEQFGMIELIDGVITIPNWGKHQNLDQLQTKKEYMRQYMKEYRKKQALITSGKGSKVNSKTNSKTNVRQAEEERDKEKIKNKKREEEKRIKKDCEQVAKKYAALCPSLPPLEILSDSIKTDLIESIEKYGLDKFDLLFTKAAASSFLSGDNERKWVASFDWLIKADNIAKVLNGKFDNKQAEVSEYAKYFEQIVAEDWEKKEQPKTAKDCKQLQAKVEALKEKILG
jgi:predicted phage replisome organizer